MIICEILIEFVQYRIQNRNVLLHVYALIVSENRLCHVIITNHPPIHTLHNTNRRRRRLRSQANLPPDDGKPTPRCCWPIWTRRKSPHCTSQRWRRRQASQLTRPVRKVSRQLSSKCLRASPVRDGKKQWCISISHAYYYFPTIDSVLFCRVDNNNNVLHLFLFPFFHFCFCWV